MQIQLKQAEIISALKQYISNQGINLHGKTVEISFTAGRKEAGLSADLVIEDAFVGSFDFEEPNVVTKPVLSVVSSLPDAVALIATPETDAALAEEVPSAIAGDVAEAAPKATISLFS